MRTVRYNVTIGKGIFGMYTDLWDLYFLTDECIEFDQKLELWFETVFERMEKLWHFSNLRHHRADVANSKNYLVVERISVAGTATPESTFDYDCELYDETKFPINRLNW